MVVTVVATLATNAFNANKASTAVSAALSWRLKACLSAHRIVAPLCCVQLKPVNVALYKGVCTPALSADNFMLK